jgi:hypothetical protein
MQGSQFTGLKADYHPGLQLPLGPVPPSCLRLVLSYLCLSRSVPVLPPFFSPPLPCHPLTPSALISRGRQACQC